MYFRKLPHILDKENKKFSNFIRDYNFGNLEINETNEERMEEEARSDIELDLRDLFHSFD